MLHCYEWTWSDFQESVGHSLSACVTGVGVELCLYLFHEGKLAPATISLCLSAFTPPGVWVWYCGRPKMWDAQQREFFTHHQPACPKQPF